MLGTAARGAVGDRRGERLVIERHDLAVAGSGGSTRSSSRAHFSRRKGGCGPATATSRRCRRCVSPHLSAAEPVVAAADLQPFVPWRPRRPILARMRVQRCSGAGSRSSASTRRRSSAPIRRAARRADAPVRRRRRPARGAALAIGASGLRRAARERPASSGVTRCTSASSTSAPPTSVSRRPSPRRRKLARCGGPRVASPRCSPCR